MIDLPGPKCQKCGRLLHAPDCLVCDTPGKTPEELERLKEKPLTELDAALKKKRLGDLLVDGDQDTRDFYNSDYEGFIDKVPS